MTYATLAADILELAALRDRTQVLKALAARRGLALPPPGRTASAREALLLCVRPNRWLLLTPPAPPGVALAAWREVCAGCAAPVELSSAFNALYLTGPAVREVLARGCRVDLHPDAFAAGNVAATCMAQVPVMLAASATGWLLLTPSTTAGHFRDWLTSTAAAFGIETRASVTVTALSGEKPA
jgi:sarcosine oxidase subunit gamma